MFEGSTTAMVTPFRYGEMDETAFRKLVRYQLNNGTNGILVAGCTGEAASLTPEELKRLVIWADEEIRHHSQNAFLLAGTGTNNTRETIEKTKAIQALGVDGVLLITPYYNKPSQEGLYQHYREVARQTDVPIILYNVPSRTGVTLQPDTIARLSEVDNIVAVKEASGSLDAVSRLLSKTNQMTVLSGDDTLTLPMMVLGGKGVISTTSNVDPGRMSKLCQYWKAGKTDAARQMHMELFPVCKAMFVETNPMPVKAALSMMGMIENELRLPLTAVKEESVPIIERALHEAGLLETRS
jgi:4-hydroxy-tetrahydrodipicolinate synthase